MNTVINVLVILLRPVFSCPKDTVCGVTVSGKNGALADWSIWTFQQTQVRNEEIYL